MSGKEDDRSVESRAEDAGGLRTLEAPLDLEFEFLQGTPDDQLRHSCFVGLREDEPAEDVVRDSGREG